VLIKNAELEGRRPIDLRCQSGVICEMGDTIKPLPGETVINAGGGALLPGLHDHHIHLHAFAASHSSVVCGPPRVANLKQLAEVLSDVGGSGWIRGIAYHGSVAGDIDRWQLDDLVSDRPLRIQHRSGKLWIVNTAAADILELEKHRELEGVECDDSGRPNGRLFRLDEWLRKHIGSPGPPDVERVSKQLASYGVTGITDATPGNSGEELAIFKTAIEGNRLLQRVLLMGDMDLPLASHSLIERGAYKVLLDEHKLPRVEQLTQQITQAHQQQRPIAIHCVTRTELVFALSTLLEAGHYPGDRIEHASVTPDEVLPLLREARVAVVTQHGFIAERGDQYLREVEPQYQEVLYRGRAFVEAGVPLAGSSDAPYGSADPWFAMRVAVNRKSGSGDYLGRGESLTPEQALALYTSPAGSPGAPARTIEIGQTADLCLLDRSWREARSRLVHRDVLATVKHGEPIYQR
jgi:predicted amidohydrolase YtcJ